MYRVSAFKSALAAAALVAVVGVSQAETQDPLLYLSFDRQPALTLADGTQFIPHPYYDRASSITLVIADCRGGESVKIKVPDGDGVNFPDTQGPQGGKAMVIDSGGKEEGLHFEMAAGYPIGSYTVEVAFWTADDNLAGNTVGLQNIWDAAWPGWNHVSSSLRILGDGSPPVGRPDDSRTLEMAVWQANETEVRVNSLETIAPQTWHVAQFVFNYNETNPAASSFSLHLNGALQGTAAFDASGAGFFWGVFGTPVSGGPRQDIGGWRFGLGMSMNRQIGGDDNRGLKGAIDAFSISAGALDPSEFVLPGGFHPPPILSTDGSWNLYE